MARAGPRKVSKYEDRFKATAVKLSNLSGVLVQDVTHRNGSLVPIADVLLQINR
jgi:hypothetical protein